MLQKDKKKRSRSESHEENGPSLLLAAGGENAEEEEAAVVNNAEEMPGDGPATANNTDKVLQRHVLRFWAACLSYQFRIQDWWAGGICFFVDCLTSQQHASVSQVGGGRGLGRVVGGWGQHNSKDFVDFNGLIIQNHWLMWGLMPSSKKGYWGGKRRRKRSCRNILRLLFRSGEQWWLSVAGMC